MEKELESMDISQLQIESSMGDIGITEVNRNQLMQLFETMSEVKQETSRTDICTTFQKICGSRKCLQDLSRQILNLKDEKN